MLADETLLTTGKTVQSTSNRMQDGLNAIAEWCRAGSVTFRGDKVLRFLGGGGGFRPYFQGGGAGVYQKREENGCIGSSPKMKINNCCLLIGWNKLKRTF